MRLCEFRRSSILADFWLSKSGWVASVCIVFAFNRRSHMSDLVLADKMHIASFWPMRSSSGVFISFFVTNNSSMSRNLILYNSSIKSLVRFLFFYIPRWNSLRRQTHKLVWHFVSRIDRISSGKPWIFFILGKPKTVETTLLLK